MHKTKTKSPPKKRRKPLDNTDSDVEELDKSSDETCSDESCSDETMYFNNS